MCYRGGVDDPPRPPLPPIFDEARVAALAEICRRHGVRRLELFGSAADGRFDPARSDLDFIVEFRDDAPRGGFLAFFDLKEALESLFGRDVDLMSAAPIRNPYLRAEVNRQRRPVFAN